MLPFKIRKKLRKMTIKLILEKECREITGLSRVTRWRLENEEKFPARRQISKNRVGWLSNELDEWMQNRPTVKNMEIKK